MDTILTDYKNSIVTKINSFRDSHTLLWSQHINMNGQEGRFRARLYAVGGNSVLYVNVYDGLKDVEMNARTTTDPDNAATFLVELTTFGSRYIVDTGNDNWDFDFAAADEVKS